MTWSDYHACPAVMPIFGEVESSVGIGPEGPVPQYRWQRYAHEAGLLALLGNPQSIPIPRGSGSARPEESA
jgi:hypothetical protein